MQGVHPDMSAAQMQLLTAKMAPKDLSALKKQLLRPGFVEEWNSLDSLASGFAKVLLNKANATPSASYKLFTTYDPEAVLWLGFTSKDNAVKAKYELFLKTWPEARQRIPYAQMQEMRITPDLATYKDIIHQVFLQLIDGGLNTPEEIKAFLEPHSPPAPPPQITIKRTRAKRNVEKIKEKSFDDDEEAEDGAEEEDLDDIGVGGDDEEIDLGSESPRATNSTKNWATRKKRNPTKTKRPTRTKTKNRCAKDAASRLRSQSPAKRRQRRLKSASCKAAAQKAAAAAKPAPAGKAAAPACERESPSRQRLRRPRQPRSPSAKKPAPPRQDLRIRQNRPQQQSPPQRLRKSGGQGSTRQGARQARAQSSSGKEGCTSRQGQAACSEAYKAGAKKPAPKAGKKR